MKLKVLCITPWFPNVPTDSLGSYIYRSCEALIGADVSIVTLVVRPWTPRIFGLFYEDWIRPRLQKERFSSLLNLHINHYLSIPRNFFYNLSLSLYRFGTERMIRELVHRHHIQIIHAHTEIPGTGAVRIAKKLSVPVIITLHGISTSKRILNTEKKQNSLKKTLSHADRVVLVGEPLRSYFSPLAGRDDHFRIVHNGFFLPHQGYYRKEHRKRLKIISVANLHEGKGIDLTIQALARVEKAGFVHWTYDVVGGGSERVNLEALVKSLGLMHKIFFHGGQPHDKALGLLKEADVFLLPSYRESFGIANLEAMGAGLLSIGVRGQGTEAFIKDGLTGFLVPPHDVDAITNLLIEIMSQKIDWKKIATAGYEYAHKEFTWNAHAQKLIKVYEEILK